ncbi:hypothetical protein B0H10DRAFT_1989793 [Mycena sp. CBHHK59/15]|nr:hypothetical protein B0H10DRAFT_1989793 [Mycena sp. CBHHK59/15]
MKSHGDPTAPRLPLGDLLAPPRSDDLNHQGLPHSRSRNRSRNTYLGNSPSVTHAPVVPSPLLNSRPDGALSSLFRSSKTLPFNGSFFKENLLPGSTTPERPATPVKPVSSFPSPTGSSSTVIPSTLSNEAPSSAAAKVPSANLPEASVNIPARPPVPPAESSGILLQNTGRTLTIQQIALPLASLQKLRWSEGVGHPSDGRRFIALDDDDDSDDD